MLKIQKASIALMLAASFGLVACDSGSRNAAAARFAANPGSGGSGPGGGGTPTGGDLAVTAYNPGFPTSNEAGDVDTLINSASPLIEVTNNGASDFPAHAVAIVVDAGTPSSASTPVILINFGPLAAGAVEDTATGGTLDGLLPSTPNPGTVTHAAFADSTNVGTEANENDNIQANSSPITYAAIPNTTDPEFVFGSFLTNVPATITDGTPFQVDFTVTNIGQGNAAGSFIDVIAFDAGNGIVFSVDNGSQNQLFNLGPLAGGASVNISIPCRVTYADAIDGSSGQPTTFTTGQGAIVVFLNTGDVLAQPQVPALTEAKAPPPQGSGIGNNNGNQLTVTFQ